MLTKFGFVFEYQFYKKSVASAADFFIFTGLVKNTLKHFGIFAKLKLKPVISFKKNAQISPFFKARNQLNLKL